MFCLVSLLVGLVKERYHFFQLHNLSQRKSLFCGVVLFSPLGVWDLNKVPHVS